MVYQSMVEQVMSVVLQAIELSVCDVEKIENPRM
jgi:hypothetical protein